MATTTTELPVTLNKDEILRYSRHLIMPEVGMEGQQKLKAARVLCIGTGGLGSPLALYLAAAGVGTLGLVDFDVVDYTNLQRQIIHSTADVGRKKLDSAADKLKGINPFLNLRTFDTRLSSANASSYSAAAYRSRAAFSESAARIGTDTSAATISARTTSSQCFMASSYQR